jgi:hypothetical protein
VFERGHAHEIRDHDARVHARAVLEHDWPAGVREQYVRIIGEQVTGRRVAGSE